MMRDRSNSPSTTPAPLILAAWLAPFRDCFSTPIWHRVLTLVAGAILTPRVRTVSAALRIVVADGAFAALDLIAAIRRHVCLITRLRLDANLFAPPPARQPGQ